MKKRIRIAVVAPASPVEFFNLIWKGIWSAACQLSTFDVRVESYETQGHDAVAQQRILGNLLKSPPDALAVIPAHHTEVNAEIAAIAASGIPVITFNTDAPLSGRRTFVGTDATLSGALAAEFLVKLMGGKGAVASFPGSFETEHLGRRYTAFRKELQRRARGMTEILCPSGRAGLRDAAKRALGEGHAIEGIYVGSSDVHLVAGVMEERGIRVPCVGFNNTEEVQPFLARGTVAGVVDENPYEQGYMAVQQSFEAIQGITAGTETPPWLRIPSGVVFSANSESLECREALSHYELVVARRTQLASLYRKKLDLAEARIIDMRETDPLTGLWNRRKFEEILELCARNQQPLTLLMTGLNGFRRTYGGPGPQVSDEALTGLARVLQSQLLPQDYCARLGEDEFCILLPGESRARALTMKDRILANVGKMVIAPLTLKLGIQVRFGIASMPADAVNAEDLLVLADNAMYVNQRIAAIQELSSASLLAH